MFMLTNEWISRQNKIIMLVSFLDWKYVHLHCSLKKRTRSNWRWNVLVCLSEYTVTDHRSILAVNKFCACTNLVKFIFKSFVSCNLHSGLLRSKQHGLQNFIQGSKKNPSGTSRFSHRARNFLSFLARRARTQASHSPTKFLTTILRRKGKLYAQG